MYSFKFFEMYITAAIPYIRDIINSGHNVSVKQKQKTKQTKNVLQASKVSEARQQVHMVNSVSNTVNMSLPFKLVIKNNTKVMTF